MGIDLPAFEFLLKSNSELGSFGKTVMLGRQRLLIRDEKERDRFSSILNRYRPDICINDIIDHNADKFIKLLGADPLHIMDGSSFEGADVIHDLNDPLPDEFHSSFDTVIDIGTLEHVFNVGIAMQGIAQAVKVGGQFLCLQIANNHLGHGFWQFSPEVFFRTFCAENGFEPKIAELHHSGAFHPLSDPQEAGTRLPIKTPGYTYIVFAARKKTDKKVFEDGWPVQADYTAAWIIWQAGKAESVGDLQFAESILRQALTKAPNNPIYMARLARLLRITERVNTAEYTSLIKTANLKAPNLSCVAEEYLFAKNHISPELPASPKPYVRLSNLRFKCVDDRLPSKTREALAGGRYELKEREIARRMLDTSDRVIELGSGMGVVTLSIANIVGENSILSFEANAAILELAKENASNNGYSVSFRNEIALPRNMAFLQNHVEFFSLKSFEASSTRRLNPAQTAIHVRTTALEDEILNFNANVLVLDIEGSEKELLENADLSKIDKLILEIHPKILGVNVCIQLIEHLEKQGLMLRTDLMFGDVLAFDRLSQRISVHSTAIFKDIINMESHASNGEWTEASKIAKNLLLKIDTNAYLHFRMSQIARQTGDPFKQHIESAIRLGSEDFAVFIELISICVSEGNFLEAVEALAKLEQLFPDCKQLPHLQRRIFN